MTSTTTSTDKNSLSSQEICSIIEVCAAKGVSSLQLGALSLSFHIPVQTATVPSKPDTAISEDQHKIQAQQALVQDELALKEDRMANALLENPSEFEQMLADEDLDDLTEPSDAE